MVFAFVNKDPPIELVELYKDKQEEYEYEKTNEKVFSQVASSHFGI